MECDSCGKDMSINNSGCSLRTVTIKGKQMKRIPYDKNEKVHCYDCNVKPGVRHHLGCDEEICPACGGRILGCGCLE